LSIFTLTLVPVLASYRFTRGVKEVVNRPYEWIKGIYPGVICNFTQPAEDAVDEAPTGLKSALAVKIYGPDLPSSVRSPCC
jgi:heavy metal efflux system protein